jgi:DNA-binding IclR family transcriptional regulator
MALAAFSPSARIDPLVETERDELFRSGASEWTPLYTQRALEEVRDHGLARVDGDLVPGVAAIAAPVRDHLGVAVAAIGAIGRAAEFDIDLNGATATAIRNTAARLSTRLGHRG